MGMIKFQVQFFGLGNLKRTYKYQRKLKCELCFKYAGGSVFVSVGFHRVDWRAQGAD